jgi:uncharacterized protein (DUF2267 family)
MKDLIKLVSDKTGLSEDKARVAVETVTTYLKSKLPGSIAAQVDSYLSGDEKSESDEMLSNLKDTLGGIYKK